MNVTKNYFERENCSVCYHVFMPEGNPVALLQIVHDAGEHILCYHGMAEYLTERGVIVCGCDLRGHGENSKAGETGHFGQGKDLQMLLDDQKTLYDLMRKKYRHLPYVLMGQGIGSIVARMWMSTYHESVDGVMLSGIYQPKPSFLWAQILCRIAALSGKEKPSPFLEKKLFGRAELPSGVSAKLPVSFPLSTASYLQVLSSYGKISLEEWTAEIEQGLPVALFEGDLEPLGKGSAGALELHERLSIAELCTLSLKIYEKSGHHLQLSDEKEAFFADAEEFIMQVAEGVRAARTASWY